MLWKQVLHLCSDNRGIGGVCGSHGGTHLGAHVFRSHRPRSPHHVRPSSRSNPCCKKKIFPVIKNQHLLLCTLLIGNSLAMESLPLFLDKLVPTWAAILLSVTLILMFGEILPQAICTRYGMTVGATMAPFVRVLLLLFYPISYPISKVLDWMLGKGHAVLLRRVELEKKEKHRRKKK